ncbi:MAG: hypothetical protein CMM87_00860 [Rickettsiales bacterium]|nr:hypothetical protein [Rickettsiales bacterium]|tara:strand:- start:10775 stop:12469 length:1695 start_codon:yes stop_codon:yes gene_type:complete
MKKRFLFINLLSFIAINLYAVGGSDTSHGGVAEDAAVPAAAQGARQLPAATSGAQEATPYRWTLPVYAGPGPNSPWDFRAAVRSLTPPSSELSEAEKTAKEKEEIEAAMNSLARRVGELSRATPSDQARHHARHSLTQYKGEEDLPAHKFEKLHKLLTWLWYCARIAPLQPSEASKPNYTTGSLIEIASILEELPVQEASDLVFAIVRLTIIEKLKLQELYHAFKGLHNVPAEKRQDVAEKLAPDIRRIVDRPYILFEAKKTSPALSGFISAFIRGYVEPPFKEIPTRMMRLAAADSSIAQRGEPKKPDSMAYSIAGFTMDRLLGRQYLPPTESADDIRIYELLARINDFKLFDYPKVGRQTEPDMSDSSVEVAKTLKGLPAPEANELVAAIEELIGEKRISSQEVYNVFKGLHNVPTAMRQNILSVIKPYVDKMKSFKNINSILEALTKISSEERKDFLSDVYRMYKAQLLTNPDTPYFIAKFAGLSSQERTDILPYLHMILVLPRNKSENLNYMSLFLTSLSLVDHTKREAHAESIINNLEELKPNEYNMHGVFNMLQRLDR